MAALTGLALLAAPGAAKADDASDAQAFIQRERALIDNAVKQNASASSIYAMIEKFMDFEAFTQLVTNAGCTQPCTDIWSQLTPAQRTELTGLFRQLVEINYKNTLMKSKDFGMKVLESRATQPPAGSVKVRTEAKNLAKLREPAIYVDYIVVCKAGSCKDVDMVTENSRMSTSYGGQILKMWQTEGQKYPYIVEKLTKSIEKKKRQNGG